jgi:hypothetical protein
VGGTAAHDVIRVEISHHHQNFLRVEKHLDLFAQERADVQPLDGAGPIAGAPQVL